MKKPTEVSLTPNPTIAETLYAQRIAAGRAPMPEDDDPAFTPGVCKALAAATEQSNQNEALAKLAGKLPEASERDLLNQLLGQAQAADAIRQFSQTIGVSKLAYVKETKLYRALKGMPSPNSFGVTLDGTWEEFCGLLGMSDEKANQDIANLRTFGEEALESMSRMGIGYRDLAQYRRLPADTQGALIEAAKAGDKETLMDLAEQLIARQVKEKNVLERRAVEADAKAANARAELELEQGKVRRLEQAATKTRLTTFTARTEEVREECMALGKGVEVHLSGLQTLFYEVLPDVPQVNESRMQLEQVWVAAHIAASRALDMIEQMREAAPDWLPTRVLSQHCLTPEEAARWLHDAPLIESRADAEKALREQKRAAEQPRKPGRPNGAANKAG